MGLRPGRSDPHGRSQHAGGQAGVRRRLPRRPRVCLRRGSMSRAPSWWCHDVLPASWGWLFSPPGCVDTPSRREPLAAQGPNRRLRCGREARPESPTLQRPPPRVGPFVRVLWSWRVWVAGGGGVPHRPRRRRRHGGPVQLHRARRQGLRGRALRAAELQSEGGLGDAASPADRRRLPRGGGSPACSKRPLDGATARQPGLLGPACLCVAPRTREEEPGSLISP